MSKKKIIILAAVVLVLIITIVVLLLIPKNNKINKIANPSVSENNIPAAATDNLATTTDIATTTSTNLIARRNDVAPINAAAPQEVRNQTALPAGTVKLTVSAAGFTPNTFTVSAGKSVTLSVTSTDNIHTFVFDDPALEGVTLGINPLKTAAITFTAPAAGTYSFRCNIPGHDTRGETGKMIVE